MHVTVQAHPHRREMAERLAVCVEGDVTWDPEPDHPHRSAWRTYRTALQAAPAGCSRLAVVQDDAQPCPWFRQAAEAADAACPPDSLLCLFVPGNLHVHKAALDAACYDDRTIVLLPGDTWVPVVATVWPTNVIPDVLAWVTSQGWPDIFAADDEIVGRVTRALGIPVYATMPSLIDHPDDTHSLVGNRLPMFGGNKDRVAHCYVGDDADPRSIVWTTTGPGTPAP